MDWVEVAFKDVDGAVAVAMAELDVASREEVEVTVIQEPKPGFLGVGGKEAIVRVTKTGWSGTWASSPAAVGSSASAEVPENLDGLVHEPQEHCHPSQP